MAGTGIIERDELLTLIPHKGKMFLLSRITAYDYQERTLTGEYDITRDCLFYDPQLKGVPSWVSFEFIAQCISAISGLDCRMQGKPPNPGFILSVSNMELTKPLLPEGATVTIGVSEDCKLDKVSTFNGTVSLDGEYIGTAKLTIIDVEDLSVYEKGN
jgi:predicted hotdog family 3-hydroxylacyl-ACP dehydratase